MPDRICPNFCHSKHPGSGVPLSGMDDLDVEGNDAVWNFGDRIYCWLAIDLSETKKKATS
jgi:hypothetical protein